MADQRQLIQLFQNLVGNAIKFRRDEPPRVHIAARPEGQEGGLGYDVTLRGAIEAALPFVDESFKDQPLIEARCFAASDHVGTVTFFQAALAPR